MANQVREIAGMAASLRALLASVEDVKNQLNPQEAESSDFVGLVPGTNVSGTFPCTQKISSLLILVENLKSEEKKPRGVVSVKFSAVVQGHSFVVASQNISKDGTSVLEVPACGLNSVIEIEIDGTANVTLWGI